MKIYYFLIILLLMGRSEPYNSFAQVNFNAASVTMKDQNGTNVRISRWVTSLLSLNTGDTSIPTTGAIKGYVDGKVSGLATVATTGSYNDLINKPTIPAGQVASDWNSSSGVSQILNKPALSTVATSGDYQDLINKPTIPTNTNQLTNGSGYLTGNQLVSLSGDVSGSGTTSISATLATTNPSPGTYGSSTQGIVCSFNSKGLCTTASNITITPSFSSITGLPTTLSGYGITDAYPLSSNPSGYITAAGLSGYLLSSAAASSYVSLSGNYSNPTWLNDLAFGKITGFTSSSVTSALGYTPINPSGTNLQYWKGNGTLATFPTTLSSFSNDAGYITSITSSNINTALGYNPASNATTITIAGTSADLSADRVFTVSTTNVSEGANLYYTDLRSRAAVSITTTGTGGATYNSTTGALNIPTTTATVSSIGVTSSDLAISGSPVTTTGSITLNLNTTGVSAGTYGSVSSIITLTVDAKGRITSCGTFNPKIPKTYSGTTDASGNYTVTYGSSYSVAPNVQVSISNQASNIQYAKVSSVSTTGFTVNVYSINTVTSLPILGVLTQALLGTTTSPVVGATVDVLVTEK